jgi:tetratricopeptide (TPR) repeat protein
MEAKFRYPGTKPFSTEEKDIFFGRDEDIYNIITSIRVNPTTVLFGNSGTGKSSLIQAGLIPDLDRLFMDVINGYPIYRIAEVKIPIFREGTNLLAKASECLSEYLRLDIPFLFEEAEDYGNLLWYLLKKDQYSLALAERHQTLLIIFDQAEDLFTYPDADIVAFANALYPVIGQFAPDALRKKAGLLRKGNEKSSYDPAQHKVLHDPIPVRFLFAIRSDMLHLITRLKKASSLVLQNSYELLPLKKTEAFAAIDRPSTAAGSFQSRRFEVTEEAKSSIFQQLSTMPGGSMDTGEEARVEPFSLQIICSHIEQKLVLEEKKNVITVDDLGDIKMVINGYYEDCINDLPISEVEKGKVRDLLELKFISNNQRIPLYEGHIVNEISLQSLEWLVKKRILKVDYIPGGGHMYMITQDAFVKPMLDARSKRIDPFAAPDKAASVINELLKKVQDKWNQFRSREADSKLFLVPQKEALSKKPDIPEFTAPPSIQPDLELFDTYKRLADAYMVTKEYENAIRWFDLATAMPSPYNNSYLAEVYKGRSDAYFYLDDLESSTRDLKEVLKLNPADIQTIADLVENFELQKQLEEGISYLEEYSIITIDTSNIYTQIGQKYFEKRNFELAAFYFRKMLAFRPNDYTANRFIGMVEHRIGNQDAAFEYFQRALRIEPENPEPEYDIASVYFTQQEYDEAILHYQKALSINPGFEEGIIGLAKTYYTKGDLHAAHEVYGKLSEVSEPGAKYYYNLGLIEEGLGNTSLAIDNYIRAIGLDAAFEDANSRLFDLLYEPNEFGRLLEIYEDLIENNDTGFNKYYHIYAGFVYETAHLTQPAINEYRLAIELDPTYGKGYYRLGEIYEFTNQMERSVEAYKKAVECDPNNSLLYCILGYAYRFFGNYDEAIIWFTQAIRMDAKNERYYIGLGGVYFRKKEYALAASNYEKCLALNGKNILAHASSAACYRELGVPSKCDEHVQLAHELSGQIPPNTFNLYDQACIEALCGNVEEALRLLARVIEMKQYAIDYIKKDTDFYLLWNNQEFLDLMNANVESV